MNYRPHVHVYPERLGRTERERKLNVNMLRGLAHGVAGRNALAGMEDDVFVAVERVRWDFPSVRDALRFQRHARRFFKGAVKRVRRSW